MKEKEHVDGVIIYASGKAFATNKTIKSKGNHDGLTVAREWEEHIHKNGTKYPVYFMCSNDAGQCAQVCHILHLRWPHMLFMLCFAHQVCLMVGALLKAEPFQQHGNAAIKAAKALNKLSSK